MSAQFSVFQTRLRKIMKKHRRMANGYSLSVDGNGLVHIQPRRAKGLSPLGYLLIVIGIGIAFKAVVLVNFGAEKYAERLAVLQQGSVLEQVGAWALEPGYLSETGAKVLFRLTS